MQFQSKLCHIDSNRTIVSVSAWEGDRKLSSTLGEGPTVDIAEENAIKKLYYRLKSSQEIKDANSEGQTPNPQNKEKEIGQSQKLMEKSNDSVNVEPEEWSKELSEIDIEVKRLGWDREAENRYLIDNFGISERNRITNYSVLINYIEKLKSTIKVEPGSSQTDEQSKLELIQDSDTIISLLNWTTIKARDFLQEHMEVTSRQNLSCNQLREFNKLLRAQLKLN